MDRVKSYEEKFAKAVRDYEPVGLREYASILMPLVGQKRLEQIIEQTRPSSEGRPRRHY